MKPQIGPNTDLETILEAWQEATMRLQSTHESLRYEVSRLTDELEVKNRELARKNRLADLGQMASHVAHEVRNSLVPMTLYLSLLRRRLVDAGDLEIMDKLDVGFGSLETIVNDLLQFTSQNDPHVSSFSLGVVVDDICSSLQPQMVAQGIQCSLDMTDSDDITVDRNMMRRALLNLVLNALDVMPEGGDLIITSWSSNGYLDVEVADSGPGLDPVNLRRLFEPFFSTKSGGTGLGLAIVDRIAEVHGGHVTANNCAEGGAAFTISLPNDETPVMELRKAA